MDAALQDLPGVYAAMALQEAYEAVWTAEVVADAAHWDDAGAAEDPRYVASLATREAQLRAAMRLRQLHAHMAAEA